MPQRLGFHPTADLLACLPQAAFSFFGETPNPLSIPARYTPTCARPSLCLTLPVCGQTRSTILFPLSSPFFPLPSFLYTKENP